MHLMTYCAVGFYYNPFATVIDKEKKTEVCIDGFKLGSLCLSRDIESHREMSLCTSGQGPILRLRPVRTLSPWILFGKGDVLFSSTSGHTPKSTLRARNQFLDNSSQPGYSSYSTQLDLNGIRNSLKERASSLSSATTLGLAEIGGRLNKVTGYQHIEELKRKVVETGAMPFLPTWV